MDKKSCTITGCSLQRVKFKYNEEAPLCKAIKASLAEELKRLYTECIKLFYVGCAVGVESLINKIFISRFFVSVEPQHFAQKADKTLAGSA